MAILLKYSGEEIPVSPADPEAGFNLTEVYTLIGCDMVETVCLTDGRIMLIDEEGKMKDGCANKLNPKGTLLLFAAGGRADDWICGNALICDDKEFQ